MMSESLMDASLPCKFTLSSAWSNIRVLIKDAEIECFILLDADLLLKFGWTYYSESEFFGLLLNIA